MATSGIPTLDASNLCYEFEKARIRGVDDDMILDKKEGALSDKKLPSNLEYLDDMYDKDTGTSATAFLDKDSGQVIIAYTGTNADGDFVNDVIGSDVGGIAMGSGEHYPPAYDFYEEIQEKYGNNIILTGHSLGGNIAQRVALEYNVATTVVYNAAPLYIPFLVKSEDKIVDYLTPGDSEREAILNKQETFTGQVLRITTEKDPLNIWADRGHALYLGTEYIVPNSGGHNLDPSITSDVAQVSAISNYLEAAVTELERANDATLQTVQTAMITVGTVKNQFLSDGRLSTNETFFLDSLQATAVASAMTEMVHNGYEDMETIAKQAVNDAEAAFNKSKEIPWFVTALSYDEVADAYADAGVTYEKIVTKTETHFDKTLSKMSDLITEFETLQSDIQTSVEEAVAADQTLAGEIEQWTLSM